MTTHLKAVVFDWAGTVVDFGSMAPVGAFVQLFARYGVPISEAEARAPMGLPKRDHIIAIAQMPAVAARWRTSQGEAFSEEHADRLYGEFGPMSALAAAQHADLVPGTLPMLASLKERGLRIGSNTGYSRAIMRDVAALAARQGFQPACMVCADDVPSSRPSPMAMYRCFLELNVWPASSVVKVDDTVPGLQEGRHAGCWTVGVLASGNEVGLSLASWQGMDEIAQGARLKQAAAVLMQAAPDYLVNTVADLPSVLDAIEQRTASGDKPGS
jgi:phosphonoacetaldehyde hydrolase